MMEIVIRKIKNYVKVLPISTEFYTFAEILHYYGL